MTSLFTDSHLLASVSPACYSPTNTGERSEESSPDRKLLDDTYQMRNHIHHTADRRCILALHNLVQPRKPKTLHHQLVLHRRGDLRAVVLDLDLARLLCHCSILWISERHALTVPCSLNLYCLTLRALPLSCHAEPQPQPCHAA